MDTLDDFLSGSIDTYIKEVPEPEHIELVALNDGEIDPRLKLLSHSSRTTLHRCPRKYQLYRLSADTISLEDRMQTEQNVTFTFGHTVGIGVALCMAGASLDSIIFQMFLSWDTDLLDENSRQKKSFWLAVAAVMQLYSMKEAGFLDDYELVYYEGKPAIELGFQINLPNGFRYRGSVDVVLRHKTTGAIMVLEVKTSSSTAQPAMYKNSGQALGYSVVLDILFPKLSSYTVLYLVYETKEYQFKELPFEKSLLQKALWLQELLIDCERIEHYESYDIYPMYGESCFDFYRPCEYFSLCTLSTRNLTKPLSTKVLDQIELDVAKYQFTVDFYDLVEAQVVKGAEHE